METKMSDLMLTVGQLRKMLSNYADASLFAIHICGQGHVLFIASDASVAQMHNMRSIMMADGTEVLPSGEPTAVLEIRSVRTGPSVSRC